MAKLTLNNIEAGYSSNTALNANFTAIATAVENTLSRDGTTPNHMEYDLDMNSHAILNASGLILNGVSIIPSGTTVVNSNGMTYLPDGTGAVSTTVERKLRDYVSAFDYLTEAQKEEAKAGTLAPADSFTAVQKAVTAVHLNGGGVVVVPQGVRMGILSKDLNLYSGVSPTAPVMVEDHSRADHIVYYTGTNDVEYNFMGGTSLAGGPNTPIARIHNYGRDGLRNPSLFFSYGETPDQGTHTELGWVIGGSNDGNAHSNVPAHDLVIAGGQGSSYTVGTAAVNAASATVTGVGTSWTSDFIGAIFTIDGQPNAAGIVKSVESSTSLTLQNIWSTYNGITAAAGSYHLQGGMWTGTLTNDYKARLVLGQNYTWLFNSGNYSAGADYDPLAVANGLGNYPANISYIFNGNRLKGGSLNPSTLFKVDNATGTAGVVGCIFTAGTYVGTPTKCIYLDKASNTLFFTNAVDGVGGFYLNNDGVLGLQKGQLSFPSVQNASTDANVLDDYEEGTFTPVVIGTSTTGTGTYSIQTGKYTKIGRKVSFTCNLSWSAHTGTGNMQITGLPFTSAAGDDFSCSILAYNLTFSNQLAALIAASDTKIQPLTMATGAAYSLIPIDTSVTLLTITGTYITN